MKLSLFSLALLLFLSPALAFAATRSLQYGMQGNDVKAMQATLVAKGYFSATPNGYFGPATLAAVKKFQCDQKIVCSGSSYGTVGPKTQAALSGSSASTQGNTGVLSNIMTPASTGKLEVGGWVPYWRQASGTADVAAHLSQMTEVSPFTMTMTSDGDLNDAGDMYGELWTTFIAQAKAAHVRVIPTVMWGNGDTEHAILSDASKRVALEDQIADFVISNGYDGIDIDFEAKHAETKDYFSTFLKGLYSRMGSKWVYCSIEARMPLVNRYGYNGTPPPDATEFANDYTALNKYCDRVEIMTYDQGYIDAVLNNARAAPYVPVADPAWVEEVIRLASQTIDRKKILIGIPTYGYEYSVTPAGSGFQYDVQWAFNPGYATQLAALLNIQPVRNSADELSFIYKPGDANISAAAAQAAVPGSVDTTTLAANTTAPITAVYSQASIAGGIQPPFNILWWSDAKAIHDKVELAKQLGVRGVAVFKFDGGEDPGIWQALPQPGEVAGH
jgi:spore germination protein